MKTKGKKRKSFSVTHPELKPGEVFLTNVADPFQRFDLIKNSGFHGIGWKTKRLGERAYDINGQPLKSCSPVFVQRQELKNAGIDPDRLWDKE